MVLAEPQPFPRVPSFTCPTERARLDQIRQISGGSRARSACDREVVPSAEAVFECLGAFIEHPQRAQLSRCRNRRKPTPDKILYGTLEREA